MPPYPFTAAASNDPITEAAAALRSLIMATGSTSRVSHTTGLFEVPSAMRTHQPGLNETAATFMVQRYSQVMGPVTDFRPTMYLKQRVFPDDLGKLLTHLIGKPIDQFEPIAAAIGVLRETLGDVEHVWVVRSTVSDVPLSPGPSAPKGDIELLMFVDIEHGHFAAITVWSGELKRPRNQSGILQRPAVAVPLTYVEPVADTMRFLDPGMDRAYYVPRYELARTGAQYALRMIRRGTGWALTMRLAPSSAPEVAANGGGTAMSPSLAIALRYQRSVGGVLEEAVIRFDEVTSEDGAVVAVAALPTIEAKDAAYGALTQPMSTRLEVVRTVRVAVEARVIAHVGSPPPPQHMFFREGDYDLPWTVAPEPFTIVSTLHPYVYAEVDAEAARPAPTLRSAVFDGKSHDYFQDAIDRERFYYLPDAFKLVRRDERPRAPALHLQLAAGTSGLDDAVASLGFTAGPSTRPARLAAAAGALAAYLPAGLDRAVTLTPLAAQRMKLSVALPGAGVTLQPRPDAIVEMHQVSDTINLSLAQFRDVFDAMFADSSLLLQGVVAIEGAGTTRSIPFVGRLGDVLGDVVDVVARPDGAGAATVTLTNATESPAAVEGVTVRLRYGGLVIPGVVDGAWPRVLAAGEELALAVTPFDAPPAGVEPAIEVTLGKVTARPDRAAVLAAMYSGDVDPAIARTIKVKVPAVRFAATADPLAQLLAVVITFEHGAAIDLDAGALEREATVRTPLVELLLDHADAQVYRYKLDVVRAGSRQRDADWRTDTTGVLYPDLG